MADQLLGANFEDLGPEFEAVPFLLQAASLLSASTTETGARARNFIEQARRALHPVALNPEAHAELAQKREQRREQASRDPRTTGVDPRDTELAQLRAQLAALQQPGTVTVGEGT